MTDTMQAAESTGPAEEPAQICDTDTQPAQPAAEPSPEPAVQESNGHAEQHASASVEPTAHDQSPAADTAPPSSDPPNKQVELTKPMVSGPSFEEVYKQIMEKKKASQQLSTLPPQVVPSEPAAQIEAQPDGGAGPSQNPVVSFVSINPGDLKWAAMPQQQGTDVFRSQTMENIREMMAAGAGPEDGVVAWGSLPQERFMEGLASDLNAGQGQGAEVQTFRTYTIERIVSGADGELQALVREVAGQSLPSAGQAVGMSSGLVQPSVQGQPMAVPPPGTDTSHSSAIIKRSLSDMSAVATGPPQVPVAPLPPLPPTASLSPVLTNLPPQVVRQPGSQPQATGSQTSVGPSACSGGATAGPSGTGHEAQGQWGASGGGGLTPRTLARAAQEAELLEQEVHDLQSQLDMFLEHITTLEEENKSMKNILLQTCAASNIQADMQQLDATIAQHHPTPMSDTDATSIAIDAFARNNGDVAATMRYLLKRAMARTTSQKQQMAAQLAQQSQPQQLPQVQVAVPPAQQQTISRPSQPQQQPLVMTAPTFQLQPPAHPQGVSFTLQPGPSGADPNQRQAVMDNNTSQPVLLQAAGSGTPQIWAAQQMAPSQQTINQQGHIQLVSDNNQTTYINQPLPQGAYIQQQPSPTNYQVQLAPVQDGGGGGPKLLTLSPVQATGNNMGPPGGTHTQFLSPQFHLGSPAPLQGVPVAQQGMLQHSVPGISILQGTAVNLSPQYQAVGGGGNTGLSGGQPMRADGSIHGSGISQGLLGSIDLSTLLNSYGVSAPQGGVR